MNKPLYIQEIEAHLGLTCEQDEEQVGQWYAPWWVLSPTGVRMFQVGDGENGIIGMISQPEMYAIQGISRSERHRRRWENK